LTIPKKEKSAKAHITFYPPVTISYFNTQFEFLIKTIVKMSGIVKRQHFVPRTFLKHFSEKKGNEYFIYAKNKNKPIDNFSINIKNVCLQKHLYTINFPDASEDDMMKLEKFYSDNLESDYDEIFNLLNDDSIIRIDQAQKTKIIETVLSMYFRVAKWFNKPLKFKKQLIVELLEEAKNLDYPKISLPTGETYDLSERSIDDIIKDLESGSKLEFINAQLAALEKIPRMFGSYNISVNIAHGNHEFLTSDVPIVLNNGEQRLVELLDPSCQLMLNFSPTRCLTILPPPSVPNLLINRNQMPDATSWIYCSINNNHQHRNSENFILGTESGLKFYDDNMPLIETPEAVTTILNRAEEELQGIKNMYNKFYYNHTGERL